MSARFDSQGFLGLHSEITLANARVGVVGVGGGGSHMIQQLAHIGVGTILVADPDVVEDRNLNRLVGAGWWDVGAKAPKVAVAERDGAHPPRKSFAAISGSLARSGVEPARMSCHRGLRRLLPGTG